MEWLTHNALADMYGPQFLLLYAAVIAVTTVACRVASRRSDWTGSSGPGTVPLSPDPYEIAYLRGGENELIRSVVFSLIQRGYLRINGDSKGARIERTSETPERRALSPLERRAYEWFSTPRAARELFTPGGLRGRVEAFGATYGQRLGREHLLTPPDVRAAALRIWCAGAAVIAALGGYKLFAALESGRYNVAFLIIMGAAALIILGVVCRPPRVSRKGRAYLERLQLAFGKLRTQVGRLSAGAPQATAMSGAADATLLLTVGLFGAGALAGTPYDDYHRTFQRASSSSCSSGGGASCGSSGGDSGGGDGGGGGGCGGCGGGGCGS